MTAVVIRGDAAHLPLPDESVDLICTSPPYFGLRSYTDGGVHYEGQLGSEATPQEWVDALVKCTAEFVRVLKPSGSIFVNLGDKYWGKQPGDYSRDTQPLRDTPRSNQSHRLTADSQRGARRVTWGESQPKSLLGLPWRYALACMDELGLILRRDIVWSKPNGLPESVTDRCRSSHEYVFHLVKQPRYYAAVDEIREPHNDKAGPPSRFGNITMSGSSRTDGISREQTFKPAVREYNPLGKLPGSVWSIPSQPLTVPAHLGVDHFAAFPLELPRRIIAGWSPPGVCTACGEGRRPVRGVDWSRVPHTITEKRALTAPEMATWCVAFAAWCDEVGISRGDLDAAAGTSDMGGWWKSRLSHRAAVPTPEQWAKIRAKFDPPAAFDDLVHLVRPIPAGLLDAGKNVHLTGRHRTTGGGLSSGDYQTITGYACACPQPDAPTRPAVVLDPFAGTGTTMLAASALGRIGIGCDLSMDYARLARWRTQDRAEIAKAMQVPKPPPVSDGQEALFSV